MLSSPQTLTPKPAALPPTMPTPLPGSGSAGNTGNGPSFAQFLNTQPEVLTPPAHPDPVPRDPDSAPEATAAPAPSPAANAPARRPQAASSQAKPATPAQKSTADAAASLANAAKAAKDAAACEDSSTAADATAKTTEAGKDDPETAGLTEFTQLIGLATPAQPTVATPVGAEAAAGEAAAKSLLGTHGAHAGHAPATEDSGDASAARTAPADDSVAAKQQQPTERRAAEAPVRADAGQPRAKAADAAADKIAAQSAASAGSTDKLQALPAAAADAPRTSAAQNAALPNFAAVLAQALPTATAAAADVSGAPAQGQIHAAVHSNAFGAELGARVSLLAVDGQQTAELQLNPGDMGPVAVQIVVDGSQAQVSFHAAQAETRAALEKSLPDLAAALQGQGLTLSGGGVFQQAPRDSGEASDREEGTGRSARAGGTGRIGATGASTVAAPIRRTVGLLDTFA